MSRTIRMRIVSTLELNVKSIVLLCNIGDEMMNLV